MNYTTSQLEAIESQSGRNVILANPGGGKTATLVAAIAEAFRTGRAVPSRTAVITFTNAAATEITKRIAAAECATPEYIGTLHGWCLLQLRAMRLAVLSEDTAEQIIKHVIEFNHIDTSAEKVRKTLGGIVTKPDAKTKLAAALYRKELRKQEALDYDLILIEGLEHIQKNGTGTAHLFVDEFQDSSVIDLQIYDAITPDTMTVVGDLDQAIYGFRGGEPENLREVARRPNTALFTLEENFRSVPAICEAANNVISHNRVRFPKVMKATRSAQYPEPITVQEFAGEASEQMALTERIQQAIEGGRNPNEIAVLVRYNDDKRDFAQALKAEGIPVAASTAQPPDWKLAMATLGAMAAPDNAMAVIGWRMASGESWATASTRVEELLRLRHPITPAFIRSDDTFNGLREAGVSQGTLNRIAALQAPNALATLIAMRERESGSKAPTGVTVSTYHSAKGLEWPVVFMPACEDRMVGKSDIEGARRLFFVAITRARDELHISAARSRTVAWGAKKAEPTGGKCRFIDEMGKRA